MKPSTLRDLADVFSILSVFFTGALIATLFTTGPGLAAPTLIAAAMVSFTVSGACYERSLRR